MRISRDDAIAVIVDVQQNNLPGIHDSARLKENLITLIRGLQILNIPVIALEQEPQRLGNTIPEISGLYDRFNAVEKITYSCYRDPDFADLLDSTGRQKVILVGIEAHIGILQTSLDLLENGYQPVLLDDGVSSRREYDKVIAMKRMRREGAIISTCESLLYELSVVAGTEKADAVSRLIQQTYFA